MPPIWDFECPECNKKEEKLLRSSDPPPLCSECNSEMHKLISSKVSFRLYGDGFYKRTHKDTGDFS